MHLRVCFVAFGLIVVLLPGRPAFAAIQCAGPYQFLRGNYLSSGICQSRHLANVARSYGRIISARSIRSNPNLRDEICNWIGYDNRLVDICIRESNGETTTSAPSSSTPSGSATNNPDSEGE